MLVEGTSGVSGMGHEMVGLMEGESESETDGEIAIEEVRWERVVLEET